jgi:hypothetical protein
MAEKSLTQKLAVKPGYRIAVVNAPTSAESLVQALRSDAAVGDDVGGADAVVLFVANRAEVDRSWAGVAAAVPADAVLWIAYPKRTPNVSTDLSRDHGWEPVIDDGFDAVSQVSLDATWSALRFRRDLALRAERAARGRPGPGHRP